MKILEDRTLDRDAEHAKLLIGMYEKTLNYAIKQGFCYNDDIVGFLHNERAYWINKVSNDSNNELLAKVWKNGSVHIYNRKEYLKRKGCYYG